MQARFIHDGKSIDFLSETAVPAGSVIVVGSLTGVAKLDIRAGCLGALAVVGVYDIVKVTTAIPPGSKVYWDAAAEQAVTTAAGNAPLGIAVQEAAADDTVVRVRIG